MFRRRTHFRHRWLNSFLKKEDGLTIFEAIGGLIILMLSLTLIFKIADLGFTEMKKRQAADHLSLVSKAAAAYVRKHQETLLTSATATGGPQLSIANLITEQFLPVGFSSRNVWQQSYQIHIRKPRPNELQAITLTTGGQGHDARNPVFANAIIPSTAALMGGAGGFIPTGTSPGQAAGTLHGAFGGWIVNLGNLGITSPGAGHLGALSSFDSSSLSQDFLYRVSVPGHDDLNSMLTELDMTDHAIRGVNELHFTPRELNNESCKNANTDGRVFLDEKRGLYLCRNGAMEIIADSGNSTLLQEMTLAQNGDLITKPVCAPGSDTVPNIFVTPSVAAAGYESPPITALQAWAVNHSTTQWRVHLRLLTNDESLDWIYPAPSYGRITVITACLKK